MFIGGVNVINLFVPRDTWKHDVGKNYLLPLTASFWDVVAFDPILAIPSLILQLPITAIIS